MKDKTFDLSYRHFVLYAKGWYKQTNQLEDLKAILGNRCALETKDVRPHYVEAMLLDIVYEIFTIEDFPEYKFKEFVIGKWGDTLIDRCLSEMSVFEVKKYGVDLGNPDPNVLPLKEK